MSSVYNLLIGVTWRNISFDRTWGIGSSSEPVDWGIGLVDLTPWHFWTICPIFVASADVQYLVALASVSPGHNEWFPAPMDFSHVDHTGYPAAAWKYLIRAATLGRS